MMNVTRSLARMSGISRRGLATEIPIGSVARIVRFSVADEAAAMKADELVALAKTDLEAAKLPGYVKTVRTVCKAEWAYEIAIVMDSLDNFKGCESSLPKLSLPRSCTLPPSPTLWSPASADMGSDVRNEKLMPRLEALNKLATDPDAVYSGNRVYDEM